MLFYRKYILRGRLKTITFIKIKSANPEIYKSNINNQKNKFLSYLSMRSKWWITFLIVIAIFSLGFIGCFIEKLDDTEKLNKLINTRITNIVTIVSIAIIVIGLLINNTIRYEKHKFEIILKETYISLIITFFLSTISSMIILSIVSFFIESDKLIAFVLISHLMILTNIFLIGFLFVRIVSILQHSNFEKFYVNYLNEKYKIELFKVFYKSISKYLLKKSYSKVDSIGSYFGNLNFDSSNKKITAIDLKNNKPVLLTDIKVKKLEEKLIKLNGKINNFNITYKDSYIHKELLNDYTVFWINHENIKPKPLRRLFKTRKISKGVKYYESNLGVLQEFLENDFTSIIKNKDLVSLENRLSLIVEILEIYSKNISVWEESIDFNGGFNNFYHFFYQKFIESNEFYSKHFPTEIDKLYTFIFSILSDSTFTKSLLSYSNFIGFPISVLIYNKDYFNINRNDIRIFYSDCIQSLNAHYTIDKSKVDVYIEYRNFYYKTLESLSTYYYNLLINKDIDEVDKTKEKNNDAYKNIKQDLNGFLFELEYGSVKSKYKEDEIKIYLEDLKAYCRHFEIGIQSWVWELYSKKYFNNNDNANLIEYLKIPIFIDGVTYENFTEIVNDIIFVNDNLAKRSNVYQEIYFSWENWRHIDSINRRPYEWLNDGIILLLIKFNYLLNQDYKGNDSNLKVFKDFVHVFKRICEKIDREFEKWKIVFSQASKNEITHEVIKERIQKIKMKFYDLKKRYESYENKMIIENELDNTKVNSFINYLGLNWLSSSLLHQLFINYKCINIVDKTSDKLQNEYFLENSRTQFIKETQEENYFYRTFGIDFGEKEDNFIFKKILTPKEKTSIKNLSNAIDIFISKLEKEEFKPNIIIISRYIKSINLETLEGKNFDDSFDERFDKMNISHHGKYRDIPIVYTYSRIFRNMILVADFNSSFSLNIIENNEWYKNQLNVSLNEVSSTKAEDIYKSNPQKWDKNEDGVEISYSESIEKIMTSLIINLELSFDFEIKNNKAFYLGKFE
jgi:phosphatidylglycerophosphate synthase